nr:MAG TPA: hypothetical protein [Bacteriophage sp.]
MNTLKRDRGENPLNSLQRSEPLTKRRRKPC